MGGMTDKMSQAGGGRAPMGQGAGSPKKGERFRCAKCGVEAQVTADCRCDGPSGVHFRCCGQGPRRA